jgi:hypothetical protein
MRPHDEYTAELQLVLCASEIRRRHCRSSAECASEPRGQPGQLLAARLRGASERISEPVVTVNVLVVRPVWSDVWRLVVDQRGL